MLPRWIKRITFSNRAAATPQLTGRLTGRIKWFNNSQAYGFIKSDGGPDAFLYGMEILETRVVVDEAGKAQTVRVPRQMAEGERVEFEVEDGPRGPQARRVVLI